jgi:hypothetical protein
MTEAEWEACEDPHRMIALAYGQSMRTRGRTPSRPLRATRRSLRLFACAACRLVWDDLQDHRARQAVEVSEAFADDPARIYALNAARAAARASIGETRHWSAELGRLAATSQETLQDAAARIVRIVSDRCAERGLGWVLWARPYQTQEQIAAWRGARVEACRPLCALLRDLFCVPPRAVAFDPAWRSSVVAVLARAAHDERELPSGRLDPARLAVLSDALEEAGCADEAILAHLRSPGPHVRGCWALDLVLGMG